MKIRLWIETSRQHFGRLKCRRMPKLSYSRYSHSTDSEITRICPNSVVCTHGYKLLCETLKVWNGWERDPEYFMPYSARNLKWFIDSTIIQFPKRANEFAFFWIARKFEIWIEFAPISSIQFFWKLHQIWARNFFVRTWKVLGISAKFLPAIFRPHFLVWE